MEHVSRWTELIGVAIEAVGVSVIVLGALVTTCAYPGRLKKQGPDAAYLAYRRGLARSILLGIEFLVAGDIVRTVVVEPAWDRVGVLAVIVLIRTFLSFSLELELNGRWPWQGRRHPQS